MTTGYPNVDLLFARARIPGSEVQQNPVTGGHYVPPYDSVRRQKRLAQRALVARQLFAVDGPPDAQPLPLSYAEREEFKNGSLHPNRVHYIVSLFAFSVAARDYAYENHPSWEDFARGVLASPSAHDFLTNDPILRRRYPPRPLTGLNSGCCWQPAKKTR